MSSIFDLIASSSAVSHFENIQRMQNAVTYYIKGFFALQNLVGGGKGGSGNSRKRSIRDIDSVADTSLIGAVISRAIHDGLLR